MSANYGRHEGQPRPSKGSPDPAVVVCPQCGNPLPQQTVGGSCPRCLMGFALTDTLADVDESGFSRLGGGLPKEFGRYTIVRRLGQGTMGIVYLGRDSQLGRLVAIKVPLFGTSSENAVVDRFQREVRSAAALRHPNICPIHDVGQIDGTWYMTMAYIEGRSLADLIAAGTELSVWLAVQMVRKMALALAEAHRQGVIHRDLKPANVMIDHRDEPLIMDFGLARRRQEDLKVTRSGTLVGTPAYMPPEQVRGEDTTPASDIYSLGVIFYELLTRRLPFHGELFDVLSQIVQSSPPAPSTIVPGLSDELDAVCMRALAKNPKDRFESMEEFAGRLSNYLQRVEPRETTIAAPPLLSQRWWRRMPSSVGYGLACAGGCLLILVALAVFWSRTPAEPPQSAQAQALGRETSPDSETAESEDRDQPSAEQQTDNEAQTVENSDLNNLVMGRYLCFVDRNWDQGLPLLAQSSDEGLRSLALRELAVGELSGESLIAENVSLADSWDEFARREVNPAIEAAMKARAAERYQTVLGSLHGTQANRVRAWLTEYSAGQTPSAATAAAEQAATDVEKPAAAFESAGDSNSAGQSTARSAETSTDGGETGKVLVRMALSELRRIDSERRALAEEVKESLARRDIDIPQALVKATGEVARLNRLGEELTNEIREIDITARDLQKQRATEENRFAVLSIDRKLQLLAQRRVRAVQRGTGYAKELRGQSTEIERLQSELVRLRHRIEQSTTIARRLLGQAFWAAEPTGSFSGDDYLQIAQVFTNWLGANGRQSDTRALALANADQLDSATEDAKQAVHFNPKSSLALAAQGYVKAKTGQEAEAIRELTRSLRLAPRFSAGYLVRALVYRQTGKDESALRDLQRAVDLMPSNTWIHCHLALQFAASREAQHRDGARAAKHAQIACSGTEGDSWVWHFALAAARAELGQFSEALVAQQAAIELAPTERKPLLKERLLRYQSDQPYRFE